MLDYILKNFSCDSKFINDLDGVYKYLDSLSLNNQEKNQVLIDVLNYNEEMYLLMKKENKELEKIMSKPVSNNCLYKELEVSKEELIKSEDNIITLEMDVKEILSRIRMSKSYEDIKNSLPVKNSLNYNHIINVIILGLYEDIISYKKLLILDNNMSIQDLEDIKTEINGLLLKINYLKKLNYKPVNLIEKKQEPVNTLLFLQTTSGNYSIFSDLKEIASENYGWFYTLLTEMMDNNFKNFKHLTNNGNISGTMEVKYNQARITFIPIGKNKYVILDMFIKKVNSDASYKAALKNKYDLFKENFSTINNLMFNESYLLENKKVLDNLLSTLSAGNKVKKIGDING